MLETIHYGGHDCCVLENDSLKLLVTKSVGPRVISFGFKNEDNLFAELPDFVTELPQGGVFHFYGGHRLWVAPERFDSTYIPDDDPVEISIVENGLSVKQSVQHQIGLEKSMEIVLSDERQVTITHQITNRRAINFTCAPWAITQFKIGGMAILPMSQIDAGVLPNRSLALWSYTDMSSSNVRWGKEYVLVFAQMETPFKVGFANPRGWLAYWLNGTLFVKHADHEEKAQYFDFNSSSECYCNDQFLELETLAPITTIAQNETAIHVEIWDLYKDIKYPKTHDDVKALVEKLGLE